MDEISNSTSIINAIKISYYCVYKIPRKPVIISSIFESIEYARKEYKKLMGDFSKKKSICKAYLSKSF